MSFIIFIIFMIIIICSTNKKNNKKNSTINSTTGTEKTKDTMPSVKQVNIEPEYLKSENEIIQNIIKQELKQNQYDGKDIAEVEKKRLKITIIFSILNLIFISLIFFHLPIGVYLLEVVNILIYIAFMRKYNTVKYIQKEIKSRPDEDISNIVSSILASGTVKKSKKIIITVILNCFAVILPIIIFFNPITFYEKSDDGYYVRFYTIGLSNNSTAIIPETHNGELVVGLRGDVFANMYSLESIELPDSIEVIRGKAFKNDASLTEIKLPENLTYLGGSAFRGCTSLQSITIPKGVTVINGNTFEDCYALEEVNLHEGITEIHGETFMNCESLEEIDLPNKITEIRGNTFEGCTSLKSIDIPEGVTRIAAHAFYGCSSLSEVNVPSTVKEIGSSAFRLCTSLTRIKIPKNAVVDERAFKESPTIVTNSSNSIDVNTTKNSVYNESTNKTNSTDSHNLTTPKTPKVTVYNGTTERNVLNSQTSY